MTGRIVPRSAAVTRRTRPHVPVESVDVPGCCTVCNLPIGRKPYPSELHVDQLPAVDPDITDAERRRLGEHQED
ncbi:hypothetical protein ABZS66_19100 [Dactylosporangium sp. NPDC005572]|uniref:hypothetical protein n=1 Tax=Dactylosporangium sp. NPDC005572 TaxID=3156889 RepID=UPI00339EFA13